MRTRRSCGRFRRCARLRSRRSACPAPRSRPACSALRSCRCCGCCFIAPNVRPHVAPVFEVNRERRERRRTLGEIVRVQAGPPGEGQQHARDVVVRRVEQVPQMLARLMRSEAPISPSRPRRVTRSAGRESRAREKPAAVPCGSSAWQASSGRPGSSLLGERTKESRSQSDPYVCCVRAASVPLLMSRQLLSASVELCSDRAPTLSSLMSVVAGLMGLMPHSSLMYIWLRARWVVVVKMR